MVAICIQCVNMETDRKYLSHLEYSCWYNFTCRHFKPESRIDYVTGRTVQDVAYCREHNKEGKCLQFEERKDR